MKFDYLTDDSERSLAPFFSAKMLSITLNCILILGLVLLTFWPREELYSFVMGHRVPTSFLVVFATTLVMISYMNLRCGRGEIFQNTISARLALEGVTTYEESHNFFSYGLAVSLLHTLFLLLILLPLLIVSAAVSEISSLVLLKSLAIIFTASILCRMFGFLMFLFWGRWHVAGYLATRAFFILFMFVTAVFAPYANPARLLHALYRGKDLISPFSIGAYSLYMITVTSAILVLVIANQVMVKRNPQGKRHSSGRPDLNMEKDT